jgi:class 3 adenylate cyclase
MIKIAYTYNSKESKFECGGDEVVIGRPKDGVSINLDLSPDLGVSRPHAKVWLEQGRYWIEDLNSRYGTSVDGSRLKSNEKRELPSGHEIGIGETTLHVEIPTLRPVEITTSRPGDVPIGHPDLADSNSAVHIGEKLDAASSPFSSKVASSGLLGREALLYELPLKLAEETTLEPLLKIAIEQLVAAIPDAQSGALLIKDRTSDRLLPKAESPPGKGAYSATLARRALDSRQAFTWLSGSDLTRSQTEQSIQSGIYAPLIWRRETLGVACVSNHQGGRIFTGDDLRLMVAVVHHVAMMIGQQRLLHDLEVNTATLERMLTNFSPEVRQTIMAIARQGKLNPGAETSELAILISDIRGFTRLTAEMDSYAVEVMLTEYFSPLVQSIFDNNGVVERFIGDSIIAVFGVSFTNPESSESSARQSKKYEDAVGAALAMQEVMKRINQDRLRRKLKICEIGVGLHCGEIRHGFIGSKELMKYTIIGHAANLTSRYCEGAGPGEIVISPDLRAYIADMIEAEWIEISTKHEGTLEAFKLKRIKST